MENFLFTTGSEFSLTRNSGGLCSYHSCETYLEFHFYFSQETGNPLKLCNLQRTEGKDYVQRNKLVLWSVLFHKPCQTSWREVISTYDTCEFCGLRISMKRMLLFYSVMSGACIYVFACGWLGFFTMSLSWDSGTLYMVCWCSRQDRSRTAIYEIPQNHSVWVLLMHSVCHDWISNPAQVPVKTP